MTFNEIFKRTMTRSIDLAGLISFDAQKKEQLFAMALYGSMIDCGHSLNILIDRRAISGAPLIVRPMLEAYVNLWLVLHDPEYVSFMDANFFRTWVKRMGEAESANPYLETLAGHPDFLKSKRQYETRKAELADRNFRGITIEEKFRRAGMIHEYNSVYSILSDHAHSSVGALINRHFAKNGRGGLDIVILRDPNNDEFEVYETTASQLLLRAGILLHQKSASGKEAPLIALEGCLKDLIEQERVPSALAEE